MKVLHIIAFTLLVIGGLNWLVLALTGWEIGQLFDGQESTTSKVIYVLVGLAAVVEVLTHSKSCKSCGSQPAQTV